MQAGRGLLISMAKSRKLRLTSRYLQLSGLPAHNLTGGLNARRRNGTTQHKLGNNAHYDGQLRMFARVRLQKLSVRNNVHHRFPETELRFWCKWQSLSTSPCHLRQNHAKGFKAAGLPSELRCTRAHAGQPVTASSASDSVSVAMVLTSLDRLLVPPRGRLALSLFGKAQLGSGMCSSVFQLGTLTTFRGNSKHPNKHGRPEGSGL